MSSGRRSSAGAEVQSIPAGARKVVQSLKEIVNCSEAEIYAALRDCDMDPNEAVNRLIIQDPFHEVRSKREKKKEGKDTESRPHGSYENLNRGGKNAGDRYLGHTSSTLYSSFGTSSFESAPANGKLAFLKENGSTTQTSSFCSVTVFSGNNKSKRPQRFRDDVVGENKKSSLDASDGETSCRRPPYGYQSAWSRSPGQVSIADIVKMGKPLDIASSAASSSDLNANDLNIQGPKTSALQNNFIISDNHASNIHEAGVSLAHNIPSYNELPSTDNLVDAKTLFPIYSMDSEMHLGASDLVLGSINQQSESEEIQETDDNIEKPGVNDMSVLESCCNIPEINSKSASLSENNLHNDILSHDFKHHKDEIDASVSSISRNLLQININNDAKGLPSEADEFTLIIPDHLLVQTADCSHLRFGSFGPGMSAACASGTIASSTEKTNLVGRHSEVYISSVGYANSRISDYFVGDAYRTASGVDEFHGTGSSIESYDPLSAAQQEKIKPQNVEVAHGNHNIESVEVAHGMHHLQNVEVVHGNHHSFPASNRDYTFDNVQRLNEALNQSEMSSQIQNLAPSTNVMSHTNSSPRTPLASSVPPVKESDHQYPPFRVPQSASSKYGSSVSSIGHSAISVSEALKIAGFPSTQPSPPLPQHVAVHPYSQPTPLGPYTNMIGYPFLPQNYTFMPSAYQQTVTGNGAYQQSLAEILSQYRNSISVHGLGHSSPASIGNITTTPGNFLMNPPAPLPGATLSYGDSSIPQYKESNHLISLQQNGNSGLSLQGTTLDHYHRQNQQYGGFKQGQQPSLDYGYNSHVGGAALDQQPHNSRIEFPGRSQLPQFWQNGY